MPRQGFSLSLSLSRSLRVLAENVSILLATGGVVEELQHPDADEAEDAGARSRAGDVEVLGETGAQGGAYVETTGVQKC